MKERNSVFKKCFHEFKPIREPYGDRRGDDVRQVKDFIKCVKCNHYRDVGCGCYECYVKR